MSFDEIKKFLPQYLSDDNKHSLFSELESFPKNIDQRLYSSGYEIKDNIIYQGDGLSNIPIFLLPSPESKKSNCLVISNTCDIDLNNKRLLSSRIILAQIFELSKLELSFSKANFPKEKIESYISTIKTQKVTNAFFLPKNNFIEDSVVYFDYSNSYSNTMINRDNLKNQRLFTLSNYGFYLFLLKLSIHFTRIREEVNRN